MPNRRFLRCLVLAAAFGLMASTGPTAGAQPSDEDPGPVEQPRPLLAATATCHGESAEVQVIVYDDRDAPFAVHLTGATGSFAETRATTLDTRHFVHVTSFSGLAAGDYDVSTETFTSPADGVRVAVRDCSSLKETDDLLGVEVQCRAGWGTATFQVANPKAGKEVGYTLTIDPPLVAHLVTLAAGRFVRITENGYEDREHTAVLTGDGVSVTKRFTVSCESGNAPGLDVATSACDGGRAQVSVGVLNTGGVSVSYTITLKGVTRSVVTGGGERGVATFSDIATGSYSVEVTGSDKTEASGTATVDCGTTTTSTTATSTTGSSSAAVTTTTTPAAQGRSGGGLASTGAAVTGLVGLGVLGIVLGGVLLITGRRRARQN